MESEIHTADLQNFENSS